MVALTVMCVLVFGWMCVCRESARVTEMLVWGMGVLTAEHEYLGGTRGSGIVSSAGDVLGRSVVRGMRGVDGACESVWVWLGAVWGGV